MNSRKIGELILALRKEKNLTQRELADILKLSDRTISKWERGVGCPDVSLLGELSRVLGVSVEKLLSGELKAQDTDRGNMKRIKFYQCPSCGNILFSTGEAEVSCCGRTLAALRVAASQDEAASVQQSHTIHIEDVEDEYYITLNHEMSKTHYISFIAGVWYDRVTLVRLYPEQSASARLPKRYCTKIFACCNEHGLFDLSTSQQR